MGSPITRARRVFFCLVLAGGAIGCSGGADPAASFPDGGSAFDAHDASAAEDAAADPASEGDAGPGRTDAAPSDSGSEVDAKPANRAPVILVAGANPAVLHENQPLTISVVATDPDGIADLIGGVVRSPDGDLYGALLTGAEEGAYSLAIPWQTLQGTRTIDTPVGGASRSFTIELFDSAGAKVNAVVSTRLACSVNAYGLCGGACADFATTPEHCGACGFSCASAFGGGMGASGSCTFDGEYYCKKNKTFVLGADRPNTTCEMACAELAGAQAFSSYVPSCMVLGGFVCPAINCNTKLSDLSPSCVGPQTMLSCRCEAYYESPGQ